MAKAPAVETPVMADPPSLPPDYPARLEALKIALEAGGSKEIVRENAEAHLAFLLGKPTPRNPDDG